MIEIQKDAKLNLTTFVCVGVILPREVRDQLTEFYGGKPTLHTIWNYMDADLSALTATEISELSGFLKETAHSRAGGRSALVFAMAQLVALNDRLPSLAELEIDQGTIKIFDGMENARRWIAG